MVVLLLLRATTCTICTVLATLVIMLMPDAPPPGGDWVGSAPGSPFDPPEFALGRFCVAEELEACAPAWVVAALPLVAVAVPVCPAARLKLFVAAPLEVVVPLCGVWPNSPDAVPASASWLTARLSSIAGPNPVVGPRVTAAASAPWTSCTAHCGSSMFSHVRVSVTPSATAAEANAGAVRSAA